jgi:hypothetical protein
VLYDRRMDGPSRGRRHELDEVGLIDAIAA